MRFFTLLALVTGVFPRDAWNQAPSAARIFKIAKGGAADDASYYKLLGLSRDATQDQVKRAYRRAATKHHPDKGGSAEAFKKISEAYSVLNDPTKRRAYDRFGRAGVAQQQQQQQQQQAPGGHDARTTQQMFEQMFGGLGPFSDAFGRGFFSANAGRHPRRFSLAVQLEDCHAGRTFQVTISDDRSAVRVRIEPGMGDGDLIRASLDGETVVFEIQVRPHATFARSGADLFVDASIGLADALGSAPMVSIKRLDGTTLRCALAPEGTVLRSGAVRVLDGEGMPIRGTRRKGRLFLRVSVVFPRGPIDLDAEQRESLKALLRPQTRPPSRSRARRDDGILTAREADFAETNSFNSPDDDDDHRRRGSPQSRPFQRGGSPLRFAFR